MGLNMVIPMNCPSCGEFDRCEPSECSCPTCWTPPGRYNVTVEKALAQWQRMAPVAEALTAAEEPWGVAYDYSGLHLVVGPQDEAEVHPYRTGYLVMAWVLTFAGTQWQPPDYETVDILQTDDPEAAASAAVRVVLEEAI